MSQPHPPRPVPGQPAPRLAGAPGPAVPSPGPAGPAAVAAAGPGATASAEAVVAALHGEAAALETVAGRPLAEHVEVFDHVHQQIQAALARIDGV